VLLHHTNSADHDENLLPVKDAMWMMMRTCIVCLKDSDSQGWATGLVPFQDSCFTPKASRLSTSSACDL